MPSDNRRVDTSFFIDYTSRSPVDILSLTHQLMDGEPHHIQTSGGVINDRISEVGRDRTGLYVKSRGRVKLYVERNDGTDMNTRIN